MNTPDESRPDDLPDRDDPEFAAFLNAVDQAIGPLHDREGHRIDFFTAARLSEADGGSYRRIGWDQVGPYTVSTAWLLGSDLSGGKSEEPVLFETMVFGPDDPENPDTIGGMGTPITSRRYTSEKDAIEGHHEVVTMLRATVSDDPATLLAEPEIDTDESPEDQ